MITQTSILWIWFWGAVCVCVCYSTVHFLRWAGTIEAIIELLIAEGLCRCPTYFFQVPQVPIGGTRKRGGKGAGLVWTFSPGLPFGCVCGCFSFKVCEIKCVSCLPTRMFLQNRSCILECVWEQVCIVCVLDECECFVSLFKWPNANACRTALHFCQTYRLSRKCLVMFPSLVDVIFCLWWTPLWFAFFYIQCFVI